LRKQEVLSATEQSSLIAEHAARKAADKMQETLQDIAHGRDRMLEEERVHAQRLNRARMQARQAQLRREVAEKETQQTKEIVTTHGAMQAHLLQLQQAQMRTELERDLVLSTSAAVNSDELRQAKVLPHRYFKTDFCGVVNGVSGGCVIISCSTNKRRCATPC
jgi:serine phosphatase RsbU (regulator of sigma subunit)